MRATRFWTMAALAALVLLLAGCGDDDGDDTGGADVAGDQDSAGGAGDRGDGDESGGGADVDDGNAGGGGSGPAGTVTLGDEEFALDNFRCFF